MGKKQVRRKKLKGKIYNIKWMSKNESTYNPGEKFCEEELTAQENEKTNFEQNCSQNSVPLLEGEDSQEIQQYDKKVFESLQSDYSEGSGERSTQNWQKTWTNFKYTLKKTVSDIRHDLNDTGGGPAKGGTLTDLEVRILNILGQSFHEGIGRKYIGFYEPSSPPPTSSDMMEPSSKRMRNERSVTHFNNDDESSVVTPSKGVLTNHDYVRQPSSTRTKSVKPSNEMEAIYKDKLSELKNINSSLKELTSITRGHRTGGLNIPTTLQEDTIEHTDDNPENDESPDENLQNTEMQRNNGETAEEPSNKETNVHQEPNTEKPKAKRIRRGINNDVIKLWKERDQKR
ncbi:hypothetical protein FQR65_LT17359 [Abscondita terminalis]|nr:hypothetical protein FQR65_LT17359 [Abscondita terminalis]